MPRLFEFSIYETIEQPRYLSQHVQSQTTVAELNQRAVMHEGLLPTQPETSLALLSTLK